MLGLGGGWRVVDSCPMCGYMCWPGLVRGGRQETVLGPDDSPGRSEGAGPGRLSGGGNQREELGRPPGEQPVDRNCSQWNKPVVPRHQGNSSKRTTGSQSRILDGNFPAIFTCVSFSFQEGTDWIENVIDE